MIDRKTYEKEYMGKIVSDKEIINFLQNENRNLKKENAKLKENHESDKRALKLIVEKGSKLEKENEELKEQVEDWKADHEHNLELMKGLNVKIAELKMQIEKMESFIHSEIDFCMYCPLTTDCLNDEGTCPYAGISEDEQKKLLAVWVQNKREK